MQMYGFQVKLNYFQRYSRLTKIKSTKNKNIRPIIVAYPQPNPDYAERNCRLAENHYERHTKREQDEQSSESLPQVYRKIC
jgi:hypothetical protein